MVQSGRSESPPHVPDLVAAAQAMTRRRLRFALPLCLVSFGGFMLVTALSGFSDVLDAPVVGPLTWLFLLLTLGFPLVGVCAVLYRRRAEQWDEERAEVLRAVRSTS
ncbi:DUF485 domain-containing protein [Pseudonocardia nematodicida]|uniref:DUF485 domain-containing protein n=1 Tax=Pseudonocardia nematodicida TaxID=1206997 RepID=A0ABV1K593_9PSEU